MTTYSLVLFIHVVSTIGLFVALALEGGVLARIRSAQTIEQERFFLRVFDQLRIIYIPSLLGILVGGLYLAASFGGWPSWITSSLAATLAIMLIGGIITGRKMSRLKKMPSGDEAASLEAVSAQAKSKPLLISYGVRAGLALGIVFLMTAKPELVGSLVALGAGTFTGLIGVRGLRNIADRAGERCKHWGWAAHPAPEKS